MPKEDKALARKWLSKGTVLKRCFVIAVALSLVVAMLGRAQEFGISPELLKKAQDEYGSSAKERLLHWQNFINKYKGRKDISEFEKLKAVNDYFNERIEFVDDIDHWDEEDYWASPVETLGSEGGDCEDFVIVKYFTLKEIGISVKKMMLTYVKALDLDQAHMVLSYYETPAAEPLVIDNLIDEILRGSERDDLLPSYAFSGEGLWLAKQRGLGQRMGSSSKLSLWMGFKARMQKGVLKEY